MIGQFYKKWLTKKPIMLVIYSTFEIRLENAGVKFYSFHIIFYIMSSREFHQSFAEVCQNI